MGYETMIAIVETNGRPRTIEQGYLRKKEGKNPKMLWPWQVTEGKVPKKGSEKVTLHDYGTAILTVDLCKAGYDSDLHRLFQQGRKASRDALVFPYYYPTAGKAVWLDVYNDPLGVHTVQEVLTALIDTMDACEAEGEYAYRRFSTLRSILEPMVAEDHYKNPIVLTFGH